MELRQKKHLYHPSFARMCPGQTRRSTTMKWVTRERPKIDRIACPWLIRRFVEADAEFLYVPTEKVFEVAAATGAVPVRHSRGRTIHPCRRALLLRCIPGALQPDRSGACSASRSSYGAPTPRASTWHRRLRACSPSRSGCPRNSRTTTQCWTTPWWFTTRSTPGAQATSMRRTTGRQDRPRHERRRSA